MISVIMTAYNAARTIDAAIQSVLNQTYQDFELIICDDASSDNTQDILDKYRTNSQIKLLRNTQNQGPGPSRDAAIDQSSGEWITFLDADDIYDKQRLEVLLPLIIQYPKDIVVDAILDCHDTPNGLIPWNLVWTYQKNCDSNSISTIAMDFIDFISKTRTLVKPLVNKKLAIQLNARHGTSMSGEDMAFLIPFFAHGSIIRYLPKPMYFYRMTPGSISSSNPDRYVSYRGVFDEARAYFLQDQKSLRAIDKKIEWIKKQEQYQRFYKSLRDADVASTIKQLVSNPRLLIEFISRVIARIPYHIHRIIKGGAARKVG